MKIHLINGYQEYANWLDNVEFVNQIQEADLVIGEGGADVTPAFYQQPNKYSHNNRHTDELEYSKYEQAIALNIPILGICKGSQWLSVLAGGALYQDVTNHGGNHYINLKDGSKMMVTSTHHQMANLSSLKEGEDYELIGWSEGISKHYKDGLSDSNICLKEPEIVYYPKIQALGIQSHPEISRDTFYRNTCKNLVNEYLLSRKRTL